MEEKKVDFDLSSLSLQELIEVYEEITNFINFLNNTKIEIEEGE